MSDKSKIEEILNLKQVVLGDKEIGTSESPLKDNENKEDKEDEQDNEFTNEHHEESFYDVIEICNSVVDLRYDTKSVSKSYKLFKKYILVKISY